MAGTSMVRLPEGRGRRYITSDWKVPELRTFPKPSSFSPGSNSMKTPSFHEHHHHHPFRARLFHLILVLVSFSQQLYGHIILISFWQTYQTLSQLFLAQQQLHKSPLFAHCNTPAVTMMHWWSASIGLPPPSNAVTVARRRWWSCGRPVPPLARRGPRPG